MPSPLPTWEHELLSNFDSTKQIAVVLVLTQCRRFQNVDRSRGPTGHGDERPGRLHWMPL